MATDIRMPTRLAMIEKAVAKVANIEDPEELHGRRRDKQYAEARMVVWYVAYNYLGYSYPALGRIYGRDHTTIMSGVRRMSKLPARKDVVDWVRRVCPEAFKKFEHGEARALSDWDLR